MPVVFSYNLGYNVQLNLLNLLISYYHGKFMAYSYSLVSLFPPLLVLTLGYLTHRLILSLLAGILLAALLISNFAILPSLDIIASTLWSTLEFNTFFSSSNFWDTWNLFICIFLLILGIFVTMLQVSGGAYAYGIFARRKIRNAKNAESAALVLSGGLFVDDYLSCLTVGSVMYPLTDTQRVPRAKLAYLVDSMSAPLAILCPFSSWVAAIMGFLRDNGVNENISATTLIVANPLTTFLNTIPYIFYSFILVASTLFIVRARISYGIMKRHEDIAHETGNLFGGKAHPLHHKKAQEHNPQHTTLLEFFLPMLILLMSVISGILYSGRWSGFGGNNSLISACQTSSAAVGLFIGGIITLIVCTSFFIMRGRITVNKIPNIYWQGVKLMAPAVAVLMLAWSLGDLLRVLQTGEYLAHLMLGSVNVTLLPMILFFTGAIISFTIGTSWGTAAMLFPIAIPLILSMTNAPAHPTLDQIPIFFPALGAVLSGCIAGSHTSPIADTTIMASLSTGANLKDHICTQLQYALPGIFVTGLAFYVSGYLLPYGNIITIFIPIATAILVNMLILWVLNKNTAE